MHFGHARGAGALLVATGLLLVTSVASASGLFVARFGGEHGHPTTDNATAIYYNPAGLALVGGTRFMIDGTFAWRTATYERAPGSITDLLADGGTPVKASSGWTPGDMAAANSGKATLANPAAAPFIGVASDLGIKGLGVGLAFFAPIGGAAEWDGNDDFKGNTDYPGTEDGVARWWSISGQMRALYLALGVAYRLEDQGLSFGLALNGIKSEAHTIRARNKDGTDHLRYEVPSGDVMFKEGRSEIDVSGYGYSIGAGVVWEPAEQTYVGISYQSRPNVSGGLNMKGDLRQVLGPQPYGASSTPDKVIMTQDYADALRLGFRMKVHPKIWVRAAAEYAFWSSMERQCVMNESTPTEECAIDSTTGALTNDAKLILNLERQWQDAYGFKAGTSYWINDDLEAFLGAGWDGSAVPDEFMDPALFDLPKVTASLGARYMIKGRIRLTGTFTQVFYPVGATTGTPSQPSLYTSEDSKGPDSSGKYNQSISVFNLSVEAFF